MQAGVLARAADPTPYREGRPGIAGVSQASAAIRRNIQGMAGITKLMGVGKAAQYLGVSAASLRKWADRGLVPVYRTPGGQRRFSADDLDDFTRSMRQPAGQAAA
jgi:excisionase family DNA binding protein